jgi:diacylglycerol kinase family enzyme
VLRGAEIDVDADRRFEIYGDGDPIGYTPARIRVRKQRLRVIVPGP